MKTSELIGPGGVAVSVHPILLLADHMGGFCAVGREFGVSGWSVQKWWRTNSVPAERVLQLVRLCHKYGVAVTPHEIRPNVYTPNMKIPAKEMRGPTVYR